MLIKTYGAAVQGIDALVITIEVVAETGVQFSLVGMADTAVKESYQRVLSAVSQKDCCQPVASRCKKRGCGLRPADCNRHTCGMRTA